MASKTVDVDLRIRARNLSKSTLREIEADVDRLTQAQKEQASAAGLAAKSAKELAAAQQFLAAAERELARRSALGDRYKNEQEQIKTLAARINELTAARKKAADEGAKKGVLGANDREIARTNKAMDQLAQKNQQTGESLRSLGVNVENLDADLAKMQVATESAARAKQNAIGDIQRHSAAVAQNNAVIAEATRRQIEEAKVAERRNTAATQIAVETRNRRVELDALRQSITASLEAGRQKEIEAEAGRRLQTQIASETADRQRLITTVVAEKNRREELAALRRDIIARSAQGNAVEERANRISAESAARRDRLVRLLQTERGETVQLAEAKRRETQATEQNTGAKNRNAAATGKAGAAQKLFNDRGRESLSTYQRVRGQLLGLVAAYVGLFEAINTVQKAIEATNRAQSLQVGLRTINDGNLKAAAEDYQFLRKEADRLGLVFDDLAPQYANVAAAGKALGLSTAIIRGLFSDTATAAAAMNLSVADTEGVFRAMTQIFSKGKVQAEELRGQLGDRLPGAVVRFAAANNIALDQLDKMLEKGTVGIDFVVKGIRKYADSYDAEMENISGRLQAYINRARNAYNDWLRTLLNGENQTRLKSAFEVITNFFQGREGEKFAEALGTAFGTLVDAFVILAKNIDAAKVALGLFIGVQILKFMLDMATAVRTAGLAMLAFRANVVAAAASTGLMATGAKGLTALMGPLGVAIAATAGAWLSYKKYIDDAEKSTTQFIDTLQSARKAQGSFELSKSLKDVDAEIESVNKQLGEALEQRDALNGQRGLGGLTATLKGALGGAAFTVAEAEADIAAAQEKSNALAQTRLNLQERLLRSTREEAAERDRLAKEPIPGLNTADKDKKPKVPKGADPESVRDRVLKMTEDLRSKLAQVEIQANARTVDQIEQNYQSRLAVIKSEVAKAEIDIAAIQRAAAGSNRGKGTELTKELTTLRGALDAYREAANERAKEERTVAEIQLREKELNDLVAARQSKLELINTLQETGAITAGEAWTQSYLANAKANEEIRKQVDLFLQMLQKIDPTQNADLYARLGIDKLITGLQQVRAEAAPALTAVQRIGQSVSQDLAGGAANAIVVFGQGLAGLVTQANSLSDAFEGAADAFLSFAADFLTQIANMILQAIILQALNNAINGTSGGYTGAVMKAFTRHQGGVIGGANGSNPTRAVNPGVFVGAGRFHNGGLPGLAQSGLKPNEVPTILERGEEVVTADDPRHVNNGGASGGGGAPSSVQVINAFQPVDLLKAALDNPQGRKLVTAFIGTNRGAVRAALG